MKMQTANSPVIAHCFGRAPNGRGDGFRKPAAGFLLVGLLALGASVFSAGAQAGSDYSLQITAFSGTIPSIDLQLDPDGPGPLPMKTYATGPISLGLDTNALGTVKSANGRLAIAFGFTVRMPLFNALFGPGFQDTGVYMETSPSTPSPDGSFAFSGAGTTQKGIAVIDINNDWNSTNKNATGTFAAGPATWHTTGLQLVFPATTTGAGVDQTFSNLVVTDGTATFAPPPVTLAMSAFSGTIPSIDLELNLGTSGPQTYATGPISLGLDTNVMGTLKSVGGAQTISFGFTVHMPLFDQLFGQGFQDTGTYVETSPISDPSRYSGSGTTSNGIVAIDINNIWKGVGANAVTAPGPATWNTASMQLIFPAATTHMPFDQVFDNLVVTNGAATFVAQPAPVVLSMAAFSGTIPSVNLQLDPDGSGPLPLQTYATGPISLARDTNVFGTLKSADGVKSLSFGYTVHMPLFDQLFGAGFQDAGSYFETSQSSGNPSKYSGGGTTKNGISAIDINNYWNSTTKNGVVAPGPATWNTPGMSLTFPAATTGAGVDQTFANLPASGAAMFVPQPAPVVLAMNAFAGTIPSIDLLLNLDGLGQQIRHTGPISLSLDTNMPSTLRFADGVETLSFGYIVQMPLFDELFGPGFQDTGYYVESSQSSGSPASFSGGGTTKNGISAIDINNYWNSKKENGATAAGVATWNTATLQLTFPAAATGVGFDQTFPNLTVTNGTANFVAKPAPVVLSMAAFSGTIPSINLQLDPDGSGPLPLQTYPTGPIQLDLDPNVAGMVISDGGVQTVSFGFTVHMPLFDTLFGPGFLDTGLYVETSQSSTNPFRFSGTGATQKGVAVIDINNKWNSSASSSALVAGPATWNTTGLQLVFPAATTGAGFDQAFPNLTVTNGAATFVAAVRPIGVNVTFVGGTFTTTYRNLDPAKTYTWYRGTTLDAFPVQIGASVSGVSSAIFSDSTPLPAGAFYRLEGY